MPINGYSVGRDVSLDIISATGPLRFSQVVGFSSKPDITDQKIKGLDGVTRHLRFPDGWSGSFRIERRNSAVDDYFSQWEANYYAGQNENPCTITETIREADGSISQYRYTGVLLKLDNAGDWAGDKSVNISVSFVAERRVKI